MNFIQKLLVKLVSPNVDTDRLKGAVGSNIATSKEKRYLTLQNIFKILVSTVDFEEVSQKAVNVMAEDMDYIGGVIFHLTPEQNGLTPWLYTDTRMIKLLASLLDKPFRDHFFPLELKQSLVVRSFLEDKHFESPNATDFLSPIVDIGFLSRMTSTLGIKSFMTIPLKLKNEKLGVLWLTSTREKATEEELQMLRTFADQVSIAIYNSRLFQQSQNQIADLQAQNRDLASLYHLTSSVSQSLDSKVVAQLAVDAIPHEDEILTTIINLYDEETDTISISALSQTPFTKKGGELIGGYENIKVDLSSEKYKDHPIQNVIKKRQELFLTDLEEVLGPTIPKPIIKTLQGMVPFKSRYDFPIISRDNVLGFVSYYLRFDSKEQFDHNFEQLLKTYTNQIAIAIDNADLYETLEIQKKELEVALATVEEARRKERDMLDVMGHELRTPISIVRNAMLMAKKRLTKDGEIPPDKLAHYIESSIDGVRREIKLIETLLTTAKVEGKRIQLDLTKVDLKDVIEDSFEGHQDQIKQKKDDITITVNQPEEDVFVYADKVRTQEIMDNFFSNALKYTGSGEIVITLSKQGDQGRIDIKDSGIGISESDLEKLGRKFFRAHGLYSSNFKGVKPSGTGLGLYVTFELAKAMSGKHEITSIVGEGSTFSFLLPLYNGEPDKHTDQTFMEE